MKDIKAQKSLESKGSVLFSRYFKVIALLTAVIILAAGYFLLLGPKYRQYQAAGQAELNDKTRAYEVLQKHLANLKILEKNFNELTRYDFERLDMILPKEQDLPGLFVQMERITQENGFVLVNIDFVDQLDKNKSLASNTALEDKIKKLNINIGIRGENYADLVRFLDALESNLRLIDVNSINFAPGQPIYNINLTTYYLTD